MGIELPQGNAARPASKPRRSAVALAAVAALGFIVTGTQLTSFGGSTRTRHVVPMNAAALQSECASLYTLPGPPDNFAERTESDRYDTDALPTLITNATIWTGNKGGNEVILKGEIFLDKGIIKYVGDRAPAALVSGNNIQRINARTAWVTPSIVDLHSHLGVDSAPALRGSSDTNSIKGLTLPWLRSLDGIDTHDQSYKLSISGGVSTSLILPGSADAIGGQAFVIKLRDTKERSPLSRVLEPPYSLVNGTHVDPSVRPRWRHIKHAAGENPSRVYSGTRMDTLWAFRSAYNEARKLKIEQDEYCAKVQAGHWTGLPAQIPKDLKWEALVDVLRGRVKVNIHIYETVDFTGLVGLTNEFEFPVAAFHHAHEAYLVPDVIKKTWGGVPGIAIFATNARYKRESYRGSEFAAKILHENGIRVAFKSDHPVLDSRFLLYEAAQGHYFGLDAPIALSAVTTTPAELAGFDHRIGYLRAGYDADVAIWDSHPLALGATPKQVFIDGLPQLEEPFVLSKPEHFQKAPETPNWDEAAKEALKHDGLPPLDGKKVKGTVAFTNVREVLAKDASSVGIQSVFSSSQGRHGRASGVVIVQDGKITCTGSALTCNLKNLSPSNIVDLHGGSIAPGLTTYGSDLGLVEIGPESSTNDGVMYDSLKGEPEVLKDVEIKAVDGLAFGGRNTLIAYRSGVTAAISAPVSGGEFGGLSTAFFTGAAHKLEKHSVLSKVTALHASIGPQSRPSVSSQIAALRKALSGGIGGERGEWYGLAANGSIPLVVDVEQADHIATLLELKNEIDSLTGKSLRLVLTGATEAHLLAREIGEAGVGVILTRARAYPGSWAQKRLLPGAPLTAQSAIGVLAAHNVTLGLGIDEPWQARNQRFDVAWAALEANGTISRAEAVSLASSNIETLLGLETQHDLVAYHGGDVFELSSKVSAIISPNRGYVDLL